MRVDRTTGDKQPARVYLSVGLTAHRDLVPADEPRLRMQVRTFFLQLQDQFPDLPLRLMSALAEGGDQLVAEEALALGIELMVPLPFEQEEYERDFEDDATIVRFRELLGRAHVRVLPLATGSDLESIRSRGDARNRQYAQLGMFVSSHCQVLLALWDGKPSTATGGTAQVVEYHLLNAMPGFSVEDAAPNLLADDESDLVFHVHCPRRIVRSGATQLSAATSDLPRWLTLDDSSPGNVPMPAQYAHVFGQMQTFNRDVLEYAASIIRDAESLLDRDMPSPPPEAIRQVDALFGAADWLAVHFRKRVRISLLSTHAVAAAMGLAFILYSDLQAERRYVAIFLLLFLLGLVIRWIGHRREWQRKYLDYRGLAEGLRVQIYWRLAGVDPPPNSSLGYDSFLQKQDVELSWIRHAMRATGVLRDDAFATDPPWLQWVIARWVGARTAGDGPQGQLAYYLNGSRQRERAYRFTTRLGDVALAGGLLGAIALLMGGDRMGADLQTQLLLAMGLLPLLAGIREAYSYKKADKELVKQFRFMSRLFDGCRERLDRAQGDAELRHLLRALGCACLEEHAEWILLHRERPLESASLSG